MNENDSERMAGLLEESGAERVSSPEKSDIIIVNTCAVREKSEDKLFSYLGRLSHLGKKRDKVVGVTGCVAQLYRNSLFTKNESIDFIAGPDNYRQIVNIILEVRKEKRAATQWSRNWQNIPYESTVHENPVSSYVTIMEGCNNFCTYCVVPFTRGREKYRPVKLVLDEVKFLSSLGYKEIILLGQNVNCYQDPDTGEEFFLLLRRVTEIDGIEWIRFITSHPKNFNKNLANTMNENQKICRQLHLPVQAGSNSVLKRMKRGYTLEEYLEWIRLLKSLMPDICLSTDIIVGFPGESEKDFHKTCDLLEEVGYTNIFSFRYSPRPLSAAGRYQDSVPLETKKKRLIELQELQKKIQLRQNKQKVGRVMKVLCLGHSKKDPKIYSGRNEGYQVVNFKADRDFTGNFVMVRITSCGPYSLRGEAVNNALFSLSRINHTTESSYRKD